jgi:hypothetical protein
MYYVNTYMRVYTEPRQNVLAHTVLYVSLYSVYVSLYTVYVSLYRENVSLY